MGAVGKIPRVSFEQFLLLLEMSHTKLEWLDGVAYAVAGGSFEHSRLAAVRRAPERHAREGTTPRVRGVSRRQRGLRRADHGHAREEPSAHESHGHRRGALVFDRGLRPRREVRALQDHPHVQDSILVSQDQKRIEVFSRSRGWEGMAAGAGESVALASIGVILEVDDVYFNPLSDH